MTHLSSLVIGSDPDDSPITKILTGSTTHDFSSIGDGNEEAVEVTVTGAALGDYAIASLSIDVTDLAVTVAVTAANTATVVVGNWTGGAIDLASATVNVMVISTA